MSKKCVAAFIGDASNIDRVYAQGRRERVGELTSLLPTVISGSEIGERIAELADVEAIFSTWGMPALTSELLEQLPALRAVFYAAGSVQGFARPLLEKEIIVVSAWQALAVPVAEFTLAQILLSTKGYWRDRAAYKSPSGYRKSGSAPGNFGETVALLGAGAIGRTVIRLLKSVSVKVIVFDPFLSDADAIELGVEKVSMDDAFKRGYVVSNHLANNPQTKGLVREEHFAAMRDGATFINTGRGATVDEGALARVFSARPTITALLDVTNTEPPLAESPLYRLPNVHMSSHIAGAIGDEVVRMADLCIEQFLDWQADVPLTSAVTIPMLERMA